MFFWNYIYLTFIIIFFFCRYFENIFVNFLLNHFWFIFFRSFHDFKSASKQLRNWINLFSLFSFVHKTVLSIVSVWYFCNFFMLSFTWFFVFEFFIENGHFFISFNFSRFIDFYILRSVFNVVTIFNKSFVDIKI